MTKIITFVFPNQEKKSYDGEGCITLKDLLDAHDLKSLYIRTFGHLPIFYIFLNGKRVTCNQVIHDRDQFEISHIPLSYL